MIPVVQVGGILNQLVDFLFGQSIYFTEFTYYGTVPESGYGAQK
jgi:hypothetical protein